MKILLISHFFPPQRIGGAEKITQVYAASLLERGYAVQVLCAGDWNQGPRHWNGYQDEVYQGIPVRRINLNWTRAQDPNRSLYDNPLVEENLDQWLEEWKPDLVHIVSLATLSASVVRAAKRRGIPVVFTLVDFWLVCPKVTLVRGDQTLCDGQVTANDCLRCLLHQSNLYQRAQRVLPAAADGIFKAASQLAWMGRVRGLQGMALNIDERRRVLAEVIGQVDRVIAPSTFLRQTIEAVGLLADPIIPIPYGHDLSWVDDMPPKQPADHIRVGYIGQLIPLKGLHVLIEAFITAAAGTNAQLMIYGSSQSKPAYADQLQTMAGGCDNIHFMGPYAHHEIGAVLSQLDVVVVPSLWHENNPLVVQEAFASRSPVIGSNVGGISEFVQHGRNGLLFEHHSAADLSAQIRRVLTEPGLIEKLAGGIGRVKPIAEEIDQIEAIYQELLPEKFAPAAARGPVSDRSLDG